MSENKTVRNFYASKIFTVQYKTFKSAPKQLVSLMERTLVDTLLEIRNGLMEGTLVDTLLEIRSFSYFPVGDSLKP